MRDEGRVTKNKKPELKKAKSQIPNPEIGSVWSLIGTKGNP
jgi:hypothetical protein